MKGTTRQREKAGKGMDTAYGRQWLTEQLSVMLSRGKQCFDAMMQELAG